MYEVHVFLGRINCIAVIRYCKYSIINSLFFTFMFTATEQATIELLKLGNEATRTSKGNLNKLLQIKNRVLNTSEKQCFCSGTQRKIWSKDFFAWYESVTR
jgi:hypothetical protein